LDKRLDARANSQRIAQMQPTVASNPPDSISPARPAIAYWCQIAYNRDPHFALNRDPCEVLGLGLSM